MVALLGAAVAVPLNAAVIVCVPADSDDVVNTARPASSGTTASTVSPSLITVEPPSGGGAARGAGERSPIGAPLARVTVAVKVTAWPAVDGFGDDVNAVTVSSRLGSVVVVVDDVDGTEVVVGVVVVVVVGDVVVVVVVVVDVVVVVVVGDVVVVEVDDGGVASIVVDSDAVSLGAFGSTVAVDTVAVLVINVPGMTVGSTWTTMVNDAVAPAASEVYVTVTSPPAPIGGDVMTPAGPAVCDAETKVVLLGTGSTTSTDDASDGPPLVTSSV
jgi:hypothetical protein